MNADTVAATSNAIVIQAPFNVFVVKVAPAGRVALGQELFVLQSYELEKMELDLSLHEEHLAIIERPFSDGRVDEEIELGKQKAKYLDEQLKQMRDNLEWQKLQVTIGNDLFNPRGPLMEVDLARTTSDHLAAKLASDQAEKQKADALAKITLGKTKLKQHSLLLSRMKAQLKITSPASGHFVPSVGAGLFSEKGNDLGEIRA
jgi:hypothetical protein